jgi:hypothetical protein
MSLRLKEKTREASMFLVPRMGRLVTSSGPFVTKGRWAATLPTIFIVRDYSAYDSSGPKVENRIGEVAEDERDGITRTL